MAPKEEILKICNDITKGNMLEQLEIEFIDVGENYLVAQMPVTPKVHQPDGVLHGGASVALAESVGSAASFIFLNREKYVVRGIEISANHLKSVRDGYVYATAKIIHKGRTTQLWEIRIEDGDANLISIAKLTTIALSKQ